MQHLIAHPISVVPAIVMAVAAEAVAAAVVVETNYLLIRRDYGNSTTMGRK